MIPLGGQGAAFVAASVRLRRRHRAQHRGLAGHASRSRSSELRGLVYSETPREDLVDPNEASYPWYRRTIPLAGIALVMVIVLNVIF